MPNQLSTLPILRDVRREDVVQLVGCINALNLSEGVSEIMTEAHAEYCLFNPARPVKLQCVVACIDTQVVGFVLFYDGYDTASTSYGLHVADIYVQPEHRRQSVARMLMQEIAQRCLTAGGKWCSLTVARKNLSAQRLYNVLGFVTPDVEFRCIGAQGLGMLSTRPN